MYTDLPQFTRCCFCAPLRIGLLVWGYIKLAMSVLAWLLSVYSLISILGHGYGVPVGFILFVIVAIIDEVFTVILIVAAHKKHEKLFRVYYIYTIGSLVVLGILCGMHIVSMLLATIAFPHPLIVRVFLMAFVSTGASLMVQGYVTLLVRSEMLKLRDRSNIQFNNLAGEAQCNAYVEKV